jgi:hypothetical protein
VKCLRKEILRAANRHHEVRRVHYRSSIRCVGLGGDGLKACRASVRVDMLCLSAHRDAGPDDLLKDSGLCLHA